MIRCPICQSSLNPFKTYPYAPVCSEKCRRVALRRAGMPVEEPSDGSSEEPADQFSELNATQLYCRNCQRPMPTREKILLNLPTGDLYGYVCAGCGADLGTKTDVK